MPWLRRDCIWLHKDCKPHKRISPHRDCRLSPHTGCILRRMGCMHWPRMGCTWLRTGSWPHTDCRKRSTTAEHNIPSRRDRHRQRRDCKGCTDCRPKPHRGCTGCRDSWQRRGYMLLQRKGCILPHMDCRLWPRKGCRPWQHMDCILLHTDCIWPRTDCIWLRRDCTWQRTDCTMQRAALPSVSLPRQDFPRH